MNLSFACKSESLEHNAVPGCWLGDCVN